MRREIAFSFEVFAINEKYFAIHLTAVMLYTTD